MSSNFSRKSLVDSWQDIPQQDRDSILIDVAGLLETALSPVREEVEALTESCFYLRQTVAALARQTRAKPNTAKQSRPRQPKPTAPTAPPKPQLFMFEGECLSWADFHVAVGIIAPLGSQRTVGVAQCAIERAIGLGYSGWRFASRPKIFIRDVQEPPELDLQPKSMTWRGFHSSIGLTPPYRANVDNSKIALDRAKEMGRSGWVYNPSRKGFERRG